MTRLVTSLQNHGHAQRATGATLKEISTLPAESEQLSKAGTSGFISTAKAVKTPVAC